MGIIICNIIIALVSLGITPFMASLVEAFSKDEKIKLKQIIDNKKFDNKIAITTSVILIALFLKYSISFEFLIYAFLTIILVMDSFVDIKAQIIPNSLNFTTFIVGMALMYIALCTNVDTGVDLLLGMFTGGGIFLLIALFAVVAYKKEGMGLGDVKLMAVLGLFFGVYNTIQIFILSFAIGAVVSIILLITKKKKGTDYIAFGPFIVIATIITMFAPHTVMFPWYMNLLNSLGI